MSDFETHPIGTARLIQEQAEELAMTKAFLALAEAQRDSLRKRYLHAEDVYERPN